jgi:hypothetical protein
MLTVAGGIILAIVLIAVFIGLFSLMLSGFQKSRTLGCLTMVFFGSLAGILAMCVFG